MLKAFFKTAFRYHIRNKYYTFINIFGFSIGLASCLLISLYIVEEFSYDRFHEKAGQIYRVLISFEDSGERQATIPGPMISMAKEEIPEVLDMTRHVWYWERKIGRLDAVNPDDESGKINARMRFVDPGFLRMFSFDIVRGDPNALEDPSGIVLTESFAATLFGEEDPLGQALSIPAYPDAFVAAIVADPPKQSHLQFDGLMPVDVSINPYWWDHWDHRSMNGYLLIRENADVEKIEAQLLSMLRKHGYESMDIPVLQPLTDIHLGSSDILYDGLNTDKNDAIRVYILCVIGIMLLFIASLNFINLSSARAVRRSREVGIRKVIGAKVTQLRLQFLGESVIMTLIATAIALVILQEALPYMELFLGRSVEFSLLDNPAIIGIMFGVAIVIGALTGLYPAVMLSRFSPSVVLKGEYRSGIKGSMIRSIFVVVQFAISVALIFCALVVTNQVGYLMGRDVGFDRDQVITVHPENNARRLRNELLNVPTALSVGAVYRLPGGSLHHAGVTPQGSDFDNRIGVDRLWVDEGFFETLEVNIIEGQSFPKNPPEDGPYLIMINETLRSELAWENPIGKTIDFRDNPGDEPDLARIIGVVEDIHWGPARMACQSMVVEYAQDWASFVLVKIPGGNITGTLSVIENKFNEVFPDMPFNYSFLDESFGKQFEKEKHIGTEIAVFSSLAILVACLGLLGLVTLATQQRRREIAIRKVLGSTIPGIIRLLLTDFMKPIIIGMIIAWPIAYYSMDRWLSNFAHRMTLDLWPFFVSGLVAIVIALFAVITQSVQSARMNPTTILHRDS
ncbi:MAG: FtsX-like permease family protein [candidate division Zixibacteria bacterium]|nr:FtsX-like permease family protein [candidate division Zixibacteria bacterium]